MNWSGVIQILCDEKQVISKRNESESDRLVYWLINI